MEAKRQTDSGRKAIVEEEKESVGLYELKCVLSWNLRSVELFEVAVMFASETTTRTLNRT